VLAITFCSSYFSDLDVYLVANAIKNELLTKYFPLPNYFSAFVDKNCFDKGQTLE